MNDICSHLPGLRAFKIYHFLTLNNTFKPLFNTYNIILTIFIRKCKSLDTFFNYKIRPFTRLKKGVLPVSQDILRIHGTAKPIISVGTSKNAINNFFYKRYFGKIFQPKAILFHIFHSFNKPRRKNQPNKGFSVKQKKNSTVYLYYS